MSRGMQRGALVLGLCLMAATAMAQGSGDYKYLDFTVLGNSQDPFVYYIDGRTPKPAGIDLTEVENAVKAALQTWEDVDCAWPAFKYAGRATAANVPNVEERQDRFSIAAIFVTDKTNPNYVGALAQGQSAATAVPLTYGGYVYQCDIFLNAVDYRWTTLPATPAGFMDLRSHVLREMGHCLGIASIYSLDSDPIMAFLPPGPGVSKRTLSTYDRGAICQLYPQEGAVGSPCTTTCTNGLTCVSTTSTTTGNAIKVCAKACTNTTPGECPDPYVCRASTLVSGSSYACLPALPDAVTKVGQPCTGKTAGECGSARSRCIEAGTSYPSFPTSWTGGYCTEGCTTSKDCPANSQCIETGAATGKVCAQQCRPGTGDCRDGYACAPLGEGSVCVPACSTNSECAATSVSSVCRVCDRVCVAEQATGRQIGDACGQDSECGTNQICLRLNDTTLGVCASPCSLEACSCPAGTTCHTAGTRGERFCLRDCEGSTCGSQLQCSPYDTSPACIPTCRTTKDCPNGTQCGLGGRCFDPRAKPDAGTCTLCNDAGTPPPVVTDAGTGGTTSPSGCGCQSAPTSAAFAIGLGVMLLMSRRRTGRKS
ncbi:adhesin [Myxococcaceae bacterium JPH2]|nr:adhesin [Myxococcaceae bacterium JPH2]